MVCLSSFQDSSACKKVMDQSIDRDQGGSDLAPQRITGSPNHQQVGQSHIQDFVGSAMQAEKWRNQCA
jgi:hypothetical protein